MGDGFGKFGRDHEVAVVGDERATDQTHGARIRGAGVAEVGAPTARCQRESAQAIDQHMQDVFGVDWTRRGHRRWHRRQQPLGRKRDVDCEWLPLGDPCRLSDVGEHR